MEEREANQDGAPHVDFSMQFSFAKNDEKFERIIFETLKDLAKSIARKDENPLGALVVLGDFEKNPRVKGMVQMKPKQNPIESLKMINSEAGRHCLVEYSHPPHDGAVVVDRSGQIVGVGIYLVIDNPVLSTPEDCGTRHKAAASFSLRNDVISVSTLSEETNTVRVWKEGKIKEVFRIEDADKEE